MSEPAPKESWVRAYREAPEIFDAFSRAEDPDSLVARRLITLAGLEDRRVLELGSGTGRYLRELAPHAELYLGIEPSPNMMALARTAARMLTTRPILLRGRGESLPIKGGSIDVMLAAWVLVNLREEVRNQVLREASRILRPGAGCGLWLLENHWDSQFQRYRGRGAEDETRLRHLIEHDGFRLVETVTTELRFPSPSDAERVLGYLCGDTMLGRLRRAPTALLEHRIAILHRPVDAAASIKYCSP
ncbi:MAG: class I SAM-dependent methyltransferase [Holophagaceae bacterium]|nr:class I SAM-dependent methyltransferase [Holophagaceae bacterium]